MYLFTVSLTPLFSQAALREQQRGLEAGYGFMSNPSTSLSHWAFTNLNSLGDLFDIVPSVQPEKRQDFFQILQEEGIDALRSALLSQGHCSAIVKSLPDLSNLLFGHSSWFTYASMLRIVKIYDFPWSFRGSKSNNKVEKRIMTFSSYPGVLSSLDDFYEMDSNLVMLQTTNSVLKNELYDFVTPKVKEKLKNLRKKFRKSKGERYGSGCDLRTKVRE